MIVIGAFCCWWVWIEGFGGIFEIVCVIVWIFCIGKDICVVVKFEDWLVIGVFWKWFFIVCGLWGIFENGGKVKIYNEMIENLYVGIILFNVRENSFKKLIFNNFVLYDNIKE